MEIPPALHDKLVRVAKRARFSHAVPTRVWQAPDGRVVQVLDNVLLPPSLEQYQALLQLEEAEAAKEQKQVEVTCVIKTSGKTEESRPAPVAKRPQQRTLFDMFKKRKVEEVVVAPPPRTNSFAFRDEFLASRGYLYPKQTNNNAEQEQQQIVYWVRFGCVRVRDNFALEQLVWMRAQRPQSSPAIAICFAKATTNNAEERALLSALQALKVKLRREMGVDLICIDGEESKCAASVLALWCRQCRTRCVLTTDGYHPVAMRTAVAVSRAIPCALVSFDSENVTPVRAGATLPARRPPRANVVVEAPACSVDGAAFVSPPAAVMNRWQMVDLKAQEQECAEWKEVEEEDGVVLRGWEEGRLLAHCRLGTLSPLRFISSSLLQQAEEIPRALLARMDALKRFAQPVTPTAAAAIAVDDEDTTIETEEEAFVREHGWQRDINAQLRRDILLQHLVGVSSPEVLL